MCLQDFVILYGIGGTAMIVVGYRLFGKYQKSKQKPDTHPTDNHDTHSVSGK